MVSDLTSVVADLARVASLGLFAVSAYYVRELATDVRELRKDSVRHGEKIARLEGAQHERMI